MCTHGLNESVSASRKLMFNRGTIILEVWQSPASLQHGMMARIPRVCHRRYRHRQPWDISVVMGCSENFGKIALSASPRPHRRVSQNRSFDLAQLLRQRNVALPDMTQILTVPTIFLLGQLCLNILSSTYKWRVEGCVPVSRRLSAGWTVKTMSSDSWRARISLDQRFDNLLRVVPAAQGWNF